MEFKKIQLNGFKSFADKTNFLIENGLTGIVGPNGCGKSNIVESLRWVMGETSAKSMRGSGMEDVIFSGTSNKASKNIAEVSVTVTNEKNEGPIQYRELDEVNVRRKIEKDKGSKFYINDKEVRARDAQMFFADLSTGAHSPSMISQGRIGAIVTAKPADRRAILEEAAGISGLHVRRHEAELRLNAAENNLKRADELRRQQERQLVNLQKQAEEAARYKNMSEEIKKIEAGLYYLKLLEIDKEIKIENEINVEAETEVTDFNNKIADLENLIKTETEKVTPLREKNIENLSKIQRLNLELQSLDEENTRIQDEIENIKKTLQTFEEDISREKGIVIDANSNEKRLKEEKNELIEIDSKYYDTEKQSDNDLNTSKDKLQSEIEKVKELINSQKNQEAISALDNCKLLIEAYAGSYSKNENIKKESVKRNERIKVIDKEIESWKNLLLNSEKMVSQLTERRSKLNDQLSKLDNQPKLQAEKKGQITEGLRISEEEKKENEEIINSTDEKIENLRLQLNEIQEQSIKITANSGLSDEEVERMVQEAEQYADDDKKRRESAELRNQAETLLYSTEKTMGELGDKLPDADKEKITAVSEQLRKSLEGDEPEAIRSDIEALTQASHKLAELLYSQAAANPSNSDQTGDDQNQGGGSGSKQDDDNIVDAEYEEVKK